MQEWTVLYWSEEDSKPPVEKWLDSLTTEQLKAVAKEISLLSKCGNLLKLPHSKALENGIFELREMRFGLRVYYTFNKGRVIILLCGGDKKTQARDIKIACERAAKIKRQGGKNEG